MEADVAETLDDGTREASDDVRDVPVKRPMNCFLIFCKRHRPVVHNKYPNLDNRSVTRLLGDLWKNLGTEERAAFEELAKQNKEAFLKANPNFKWRQKDQILSSPPQPPTDRPASLIPHRDSLESDLDSEVGQQVKGYLGQQAKNYPIQGHQGNLVQGQVLPGGSLHLGKLADPTTMGGLNLLMLAGKSLTNPMQIPNPPLHLKSPPNPLSLLEAPPVLPDLPVMVSPGNDYANSCSIPKFSIMENLRFGHLTSQMSPSHLPASLNSKSHTISSQEPLAFDHLLKSQQQLLQQQQFQQLQQLQQLPLLAEQKELLSKFQQELKQENLTPKSSKCLSANKQKINSNKGAPVVKRRRRSKKVQAANDKAPVTTSPSQSTNQTAPLLPGTAFDAFQKSLFLSRAEGVKPDETLMNLPQNLNLELAAALLAQAGKMAPSPAELLNLQQQFLLQQLQKFPPAALSQQLLSLQQNSSQLLKPAQLPPIGMVGQNQLLQQIPLQYLAASQLMLLKPEQLSGSQLPPGLVNPFQMLRNNSDEIRSDEELRNSPNQPRSDHIKVMPSVSHSLINSHFEGLMSKGALQNADAFVSEHGIGPEYANLSAIGGQIIRNTKSVADIQNAEKTEVMNLVENTTLDLSRNKGDEKTKSRKVHHTDFLTPDHPSYASIAHDGLSVPLRSLNPGSNSTSSNLYREELVKPNAENTKLSSFNLNEKLTKLPDNTSAETRQMNLTGLQEDNESQQSITTKALTDGVSINRLMFEKVIEAVYSRELKEESERQGEKQQQEFSFPRTKKQMALDKTSSCKSKTLSMNECDVSTPDTSPINLSTSSCPIAGENVQNSARVEKSVGNIVQQLFSTPVHPHTDPMRSPALVRQAAGENAGGKNEFSGLTFAEIHEQLILKIVEKEGLGVNSELDKGMGGQAKPEKKKYLESEGLENRIEGQKNFLHSNRGLYHHSTNDINEAANGLKATKENWNTSNQMQQNSTLGLKRVDNTGLSKEDMLRFSSVSSSPRSAVVNNVSQSKPSHRNSVAQVIEKYISQFPADPSKSENKTVGKVSSNVCSERVRSAGLSLDEQIMNLIVAGMKEDTEPNKLDSSSWLCKSNEGVNFSNSSTLNTIEKVSKMSELPVLQNQNVVKRRRRRTIEKSTDDGKILDAPPRKQRRKKGSGKNAESVGIENEKQVTVIMNDTNCLYTKQEINCADDKMQKMKFYDAFADYISREIANFEKKEEIKPLPQDNYEPDCTIELNDTEYMSACEAAFGLLGLARNAQMKKAFCGNVDQKLPVSQLHFSSQNGDMIKSEQRVPELNKFDEKIEGNVLGVASNSGPYLTDGGQIKMEEGGKFAEDVMFTVANEEIVSSHESVVEETVVCSGKSMHQFKSKSDVADDLKMDNDDSSELPARGDLDEEISEGQHGLRKSSRCNKAKKYKELMSRGSIHHSRKHLESGNDDDEPALDEEDDSLDDPVTDPVVESRCVQTRGRTVSHDNCCHLENNSTNRYKSGDFDLEAHIATLPLCHIPAERRGAGAKLKQLRSSCHSSFKQQAAAESANDSKACDWSAAQLKQDSAMKIKQQGNVVSSKASSRERNSISGDVTTKPIGCRKRKARAHPIKRLVSCEENNEETTRLETSFVQLGSELENSNKKIKVIDMSDTEHLAGCGGIVGYDGDSLILVNYEADRTNKKNFTESRNGKEISSSKCGSITNCDVIGQSFEKCDSIGRNSKNSNAIGQSSENCDMIGQQNSSTIGMLVKENLELSKLEVGNESNACVNMKSNVNNRVSCESVERNGQVVEKCNQEEGATRIEEKIDEASEKIVENEEIKSNNSSEILKANGSDASMDISKATDTCKTADVKIRNKEVVVENVNRKRGVRNEVNDICQKKTIHNESGAENNLGKNQNSKNGVNLNNNNKDFNMHQSNSNIINLQNRSEDCKGNEKKNGDKNSSKNKDKLGNDRIVPLKSSGNNGEESSIRNQKLRKKILERNSKNNVAEVTVENTTNHNTDNNTSNSIRDSPEKKCGDATKKLSTNEVAIDATVVFNTDATVVPETDATMSATQTETALPHTKQAEMNSDATVTEIETQENVSGISCGSLANLGEVGSKSLLYHEACY